MSLEKQGMQSRRLRQLFECEARAIDGISETRPVEEHSVDADGECQDEKWFDVSSFGHAVEPWVTHTERDRLGVAFSGGGIRSATFNLGVLQGLQRLGVLKEVDYLSTVSGGGYIGGWYSAWQSRVSSWKFGSGDIIQRKGIVAALEHPPNPVVEWIRTQIEAERRKARSAGLFEGVIHSAIGKERYQKTFGRLQELWRYGASSKGKRERKDSRTEWFHGEAIEVTLNQLIESLVPDREVLDHEVVSEKSKGLYVDGINGGRRAALVRSLIEDAFGKSLIERHPGFPTPSREEVESDCPCPASPPVGDDQRESCEVRHLREFSRFLVPRIGLFNVDMWNAFSSVLVGVIPAALTALSMLALGVCAWLLFASPLSRYEWEWWRTGIVLVSLGFLAYTEVEYLRRTPTRRKDLSLLCYFFWLGISFLLIKVGCQVAYGIAAAFFDPLTFRDTLIPSLKYIELIPAIEGGGGISVEAFSGQYLPNIVLFALPAALFISLLILIPVRLMLWRLFALVQWLSKEKRGLMRDNEVIFNLDNTCQRLIGRLFAIGLGWSLLALMWEVSVWSMTKSDSLAPLVSGGTAVGSTSLFALLRRWFLSLSVSGAQEEVSGRLSWLKPILPMVLAYLAVISLIMMLMTSMLLAIPWLNTITPSQLGGVSFRVQLMVPSILCLGALIAGGLWGMVWLLRPSKKERQSEAENQNKHQTPQERTLASRFVRAADFVADRFWLAISVGALMVYIGFLGRVVFDGSMVYDSLGGVFRLVVFYVVTCGLIWVAFAAIFFDPARVGLHEFYRSRICRAFLGASNRQGMGMSASAYRRLNRQSVERFSDDVTIESLEGQRPVHLVCCAANDHATDRVSTLYRGARSATLSAMGIAISGNFLRLGHLGFSSALTASAAAFNSVMGSQSVRLGYPVSFLLAALNLRLGLWVPHPLAGSSATGRLPGLMFFREMFVHTKAGFETNPENNRLEPCSSQVHLSDGGHFENLGLYELVRRHCRYIIVSDVGADPDSLFADLGNAIRRIREDFGVEVELTLDPLLPDKEGISQQHVVVGTVHYDGMDGIDKGILVYLKPTFTGDEPSDVKQFKNRQPEFPHDSTIDQFYDESQWEAYRRLGEHTALAALQQSAASRSDARISELFQQLREQWYPTPKGFSEKFLDLTSRFAELEAQIREDAPDNLKEEFFSDVVRANSPKADPGAAAQQEEPVDLKTVYCLMQVCQLLEDVWLGCRLDHYWSHPLNRGWVNYLHRWAGSRSFQRLWPNLSPLFSIGFRQFMNQRFNLVAIGDAAGSSCLTTQWLTQSRLRKEGVDLDRMVGPDPMTTEVNSRMDRYAVLFLSVPGARKVAIAAMNIQGDGGASWKSATHVGWRIPALRRAPGFLDVESVVFFLRDVLSKLGDSVDYCEVTLPEGATTKEGLRKQLLISSEERIDRITILRRLGFSLVQEKRDSSEGLARMKLDRPGDGWGALRR